MNQYYEKAISCLLKKSKFDIAAELAEKIGYAGEASEYRKLGNEYSELVDSKNEIEVDIFQRISND